MAGFLDMLGVDPTGNAGPPQGQDLGTRAKGLWDSLFPNQTDPLALGSVLATNPEAVGAALAAKGVPPPSGPGAFDHSGSLGTPLASPTAPAAPPVSPPRVGAAAAKTPGAAPSAAQGQGDLQRALMGVKAPGNPEMQKLTSHAPPAPHAMPGNPYAALLAQLLGQSSQAPLRLGQTLGGR